MRIPFRYLAWTCFAISSLGLASTTSAQQSEKNGDASSGLEQLAWMVGDWGEQGDASRVSTSCGWTKNQSFLTRSFSVSDEDNEIVIEGTQVIGWNTADKQIQSWTFDSEGGVGQGIWSRDGNRWTVKTHFVLSTGERASSLNVFTVVDKNTVRWQSINRERGGELLPNVDEITIVRQPIAEQEETEQKNNLPKKIGSSP